MNLNDRVEPNCELLIPKMTKANTKTNTARVSLDNDIEANFEQLISAAISQTTKVKVQHDLYVYCIKVALCEGDNAQRLRTAWISELH